MSGTRLADRVGRAIAREALVPPGGRVIAALSGGGDSVALAALLCAIAPQASWTVAGAVHLHHGLRGAEADADEQAARAAARDLGLSIVVERADVRARARADGTSIETAGHRARYALFDRLAAAGAADRIATGHTRDDQAETVLLRLLRGAGPGGLAGIRPRAGAVVRPLLDVRRAELRAWLQARGLTWRDDASNRDLRVTRNRIRHLLLPFLAEHFSPAVPDVLARAAAIAAADADWIDRAAAEAAEDLVRDTPDGAAIDAARLAAAPVAVARRVVRAAIERTGGRPAGFEQVERVRRLADPGAAPAAAIDGPGCRAARRGAALVVAPARRRTPPDPAAAPGFAYTLAVPGGVTVPEAGLRLSSAVRGRRPAGLTVDGDAAALPAARLTPPLTVRSWRPGDRFRPIGLGGRKKLQDLFVDRRIPRARRAAVPVVVDPRLGIVWVVGHGVAAAAQGIGADEAVVVLRVRRVGDCE